MNALQRFVRRVMFLFLYILVGGYLALLLFAVFLSDRVIFQPHPSSYRDTPEIVKLTTAAGPRISAVYLPNPQARYTVLFSHGNAEDIGDDLSLLKRIQASGFSVFAYDYQGYGTSEGRPSEAGVYAAADAAYDYLTRTLRVSPANIIDYGRSLGGAVAVDLASRRPVGALVIESSFASAYRVIARVPLFPFDRFRSAAKLKQVRCPVLVMHGTRDPVIPFRNGEALYAAAGEPKRSWWVQGAGHNDIADIAGESYFRTLREFAALLDERKPRAAAAE